jgi:hypothetical protein
MVESRWLRWVGPGLIALGAVGTIASTTLGAGRLRVAAFGPCEGAVSSATIEGADASAEDPAWFDLRPVLDDAGALSGQRLTVGSAATTSTGTFDLPAESFAAGPFGSTVLVGTDDGVRSVLDLIDAAAGCRRTLDSSSTVIRRATIDPNRGGVIEMRLARADRADLGIWFSPFDDGRSARRILAPIDADARFGRTWTTEFGWDLSGRRLAVQSCGEAACRTRVLAGDDGSSVMLDQPDLGLLIGMDGDRVITYGACRGLPCPLIAVDLSTGRRQVLVEAAGLATLVGTTGHAHLVLEVDAASERRLRSVPIDGGEATDLGPIPADLRLEATPGRPADSGRPSTDTIRLVLDGSRADPASRPVTRHIPDGTPVLHDEGTR